ncbi:MAG: hypothetical protein PUG48_04295 [Clostridia bacterium]|nr:hypothetical protein [Clostridia bacterium]
MKRKIMMFITAVTAACMLSACSGEVNNAKQGTYYLNGNTSKPYIVIGENNTMGFYNVDFSELEKMYEGSTIGLTNSKREQEGSADLTDKEEQEIRDKIDLDGQFLNKMNEYTVEKEEGALGLYIPVNNTEFFMYVQYYPSDQKIVFENFIYKLKE